VSVKGEAASCSGRPLCQASCWALLLRLSQASSGIKGATPAELYYGNTPACNAAVRPSRAYEKKSDDKMFEIAYLDPDHLLPVLMQNSTAA
jgi:hypothetical protein